MAMTASIRKILLIAAAAGVAGSISYRRAYNNFTAASAAEFQKASSPTSERRERPSREREDQKEKLRALLDRPASAKTQIESWSIIRNFSVREIQETLHELAAGPETEMGIAQTAMLYQRWAQLDPIPAMQSALENPDQEGGSRYAQDALTAWMNQDPDAAFRWAESSAKFTDNRWHVRMMGTLLANLPNAEALEKAASYGAGVRKLTLGLVSQKMSDTPEGRTGFLSELARVNVTEEEKPVALSAFFQAWGRAAPLDALGAVKESQLDGGKQKQSSDRIMKDWMRSDPLAALTWMSGKPDALPLANRAQFYEYWLANSSGEALASFDSLSEEPGFGKSVMESLLGSARSAAKSEYGDPEGGFQTLKAQFTKWSEKSPQQATDWFDKQEPDLQNELNRAEVHENR